MSSVAPLSLLSSVVVLDARLAGWPFLDAPVDATDGERAFRYRVAFSRAFSAPPVVQVGIVGLDASKDDNLRVRVRATDIDETGFTLHAETWLNTKLWSVEASWLAIGN